MLNTVGVCQCGEYIFPHYSKDGQCLGHLEGPICGECEMPCKVGIDDDYCYSECCTGLTYTCPEMVEEYLPEHVFAGMDCEVDGDYIGPRDGRVLFD